MAVANYKELISWQKARCFVKVAYDAVEAFPAKERFGLTSQISRAAVSIPANIAEGYARGTRKDYCHFISMAYGSATELETLLILAADLGYLTKARFKNMMEQLEEIQRILSKTRKTLTNSP